MRPGLRLPSIRKGTFEILTDAKGLEKLRVIQEGFIDNFRRTYDETDRQITDEQGNPLNYVPIRFISAQDGKKNRMSSDEVSLDVASTVLMFIDEMNRHDELTKVVDQMELAKDILGQREVARTKRKNLFPSHDLVLPYHTPFFQGKY